MRTESSIPARGALALALALTTPALGCGLFKALFGVGDAKKPEAEEKERDNYFAPPQPELTDEEWAALSEVAAERVRATGATELLEPLRMVGEFPTAHQTFKVKENHCYVVAVAWPNEDYATKLRFSVTNDSTGKLASVPLWDFVGGRNETMKMCVDQPGEATLAAALATRSRRMQSDTDRHDSVHWAVAIAEIKESAEETEARAEKKRKAQIYGYSSYYDYEKKQYGEKVAEVCHRCRVKGRQCAAEAGEEMTANQKRACRRAFDDCTAPADLHVGKSVCQPDF